MPSTVSLPPTATALFGKTNGLPYMRLIDSGLTTVWCEPLKRFFIFLPKNLVTSKSRRIFALAFERYLSSVVEQWTENPRVPGSIPGGTTSKTRSDRLPAQPAVFFYPIEEDELAIFKRAIRAFQALAT